LSFNLAHVRLHGVAVALELGDFRTAARRAEDLDPSHLPNSQRQAAYWIDVARAHASVRKTEEAVRALLVAERVAPEEVRYRVVVREMVREFLQHRRRAIASDLNGLTTRIGLSVN
jgi:hypothetical protein